MTMLMNLQEKYDVNQLPQIRLMTPLQKIYAKLIAPIAAVKVFTTHALMGGDRNGIRNGIPLTGKKNACFS